jgi:hypothetical protein
MLKRFKIKNVADIRALGYAGALPDKTEAIIQYQQKIPNILLKQRPWSEWFMNRCYKKIHQGL